MQATAETFTSTISDNAKNIGLVMMTLAATIGMVELPHEQTNSKVTVAAQPVFAFATEHANGAEQETTLRRERDEIHPHAVSFSATQRTPARAGKL